MCLTVLCNCEYQQPKKELQASLTYRKLHTVPLFVNDIKKFDFIRSFFPFFVNLPNANVFLCTSSNQLTLAGTICLLRHSKKQFYYCHVCLSLYKLLFRSGLQIIYQRKRLTKMFATNALIGFIRAILRPEAIFFAIV